MRAMTLEQFRQSGHDCNIQETFGNNIDYTYGGMGRCYADDTAFIERTPEGNWYLIIERSEYVSANLAELEERLYFDFCVGEMDWPMCAKCGHAHVPCTAVCQEANCSCTAYVGLEQGETK